MNDPNPRSLVNAPLTLRGFPAKHVCTPVEPTGLWADAYRSVSGMLRTGCIIILLGPRGTGKTRMAVSLARKTMSMDREASGWGHRGPIYDHQPLPNPGAVGIRYTRAMELFLTIRKSYATGGSEFDAMKTFTDPRLLVIDEMQERSDSQFEDRVLVNIIDNRYGRMLDTVLIANSTPEQFAKAVGPSIYSRASEVGAVVECNWPSFRERDEGVEVES